MVRSLLRKSLVSLTAIYGLKAEGGSRRSETGVQAIR